MNLLRKTMALLGRAAGWPLSLEDPEHWRNRGVEGYAGEPVNEASVLNNSAAYACVNLLSGTIASLPLMVYRPAGGGRVVASDHPLYRLIHDSPNYDQTSLEFWEFACAAIELRGNFHALIERSGAKIVALTPIYAPVMPRREKDGSIWYRWSEDGRSYDMSDRDVFHVRGFGGTPLSGLSTLSAGRNAFSLATAIDRAAGTTFRNGMRPSGVIAYDKFLTKEQREIAETRLTEKYVGAMNAGRPLILEGGWKWASLSISPDDAQMLESRAFSVEEVCRFFGVPPHMIGHTSKSTSWGTGLEQQSIGFQRYALRRRLKRIEQAIGKQLLTQEDRTRGIVVEFNLEGLLRGDSAARSNFYASALNNGWMTINEVRALENLPPVPGGDVPRMQMQNVPITDAGKQLPAPSEKMP
jgi:HK97 family phage portal protein